MAGNPRRLILVIDEDPSMRKLLCDLVEDCGYRCNPVPHRLDVVLVATALQPVLITFRSSQSGQELDGDTLFRSVLSEPSLAQVPVIVFTDCPLDPNTGGHPVVVVTTPFDFAAVTAAIHQALDGPLHADTACVALTDCVISAN